SESERRLEDCQLRSPGFDSDIRPVVDGGTSSALCVPRAKSPTPRAADRSHYPHATPPPLPPRNLAAHRSGVVRGVCDYCIGGRKSTCFFVAKSTSSGVMRTVIRDFTAPLALATKATAAMSTLLGRSRMMWKSSLPKAK